MPRIRPGMKKPPPGFEKINEKLDEFELLMKEAVQAPSLGILPSSSSSLVATQQKEKKKEPSNTSRKRKYEVLDDFTNNNNNNGQHENTKDSSSQEEINSSSNQKKGNEVGEEECQEEVDVLDEMVQREQEVPPLWRVAQINRDRTRYVYDAHYRHKTISQEVYDYCCEMQFIDSGLARRWRLAGYEKLCCTACGIPGAASTAAQLTTKFALRDKASSHRGPKGRNAHDDVSGVGDDQRTCICRVPSGQRRVRHFEACTVCGCTGCSSSNS